LDIENYRGFSGYNTVGEVQLLYGFEVDSNDVVINNIEFLGKETWNAVLYAL